MLYYFKYRKSVLVLSAVLACIFFAVQCETKNKPPQQVQGANPPVYEDYALTAQCNTCHADIYKTYIQTAHFLTGQPAHESNIMGSFDKDSNTYAYTPQLFLSMQKRDSGFYQVAYYKGEEKMAMKFDITIGSGVMGQSFLTWRNNKLYQLPITYFTAAAQWANSPGFPASKVMIDRPVTARCLECHITYADGIGGTSLEPETFEPTKMIFAVDCQKCHGPAVKHVQYHTENPNDKTAKYIVNPSKLTTQQQLDVCTLCHGGNLQKTKPSFSYSPGSSLGDYFDTASVRNEFTPNSSTIDVHGNQVGLLKASKCFRMSEKMTCSTCHNTHKNQRGNKELFSQKCMSCHDVNNASMKTATHQTIKTIENNCIDCHMPEQASKSIALFLENEEVPRASKLRSHFIGIYNSELKTYY